MLLRGDSSRPALVMDDGSSWTYGELSHQAEIFADRLGNDRSLVVIEARNDPQAIAAYLGAICHGHVVMLVAADRPDGSHHVYSAYQPNWFFSRSRDGWTLLPESSDQADLHPDLALLLSTSGSTGTSKFVRLSYENVRANAASIASYLGIESDDRALLTLPFHYSYGLSVVNSHLASGATVLVTERSVTDPVIWEFFQEQGGTSFPGVPYTYELLDSMGFTEKPLPATLRTMTQAGGRMPPERVRKYAMAARAHGARLFVMYGQTEATARISFIPPDRVLEHPDCIGVPIPGGTLRILDGAQGEMTDPGGVGELVYEGPNVMLGYATSLADLKLGRTVHQLHTGDLACRNCEGLFKIVGRKSRFLKLYGLRVGLDDLEHHLQGLGFRTMCGGTDNRLVVLSLDPGSSQTVLDALTARCKLPHTAFAVQEVDEFPRLPTGKPDYALLARMAEEGAEPHAPANIRGLYQRLFPGRSVLEDSTFENLGGDSLTFIQATLELEKLLGVLPKDWQRVAVKDLEVIRPRRSALASVDITTLFRCLAIFAVVGNHFDLTKFGGGAYLLIVVAGFSFGRFQLRPILATGSAWPIMNTALRIAVPAFLLLALFQAKSRDVSLPRLFLFGNWVPANSAYVSFWFLALLVQIYCIIGLLVSLPPVRSLIRRYPFGFATGFFLTTSSMSLIGPQIWNTEHLYNRVPHMLIWLFATGWMLQQSSMTIQKLLAIFLVFYLSLALWGAESTGRLPISTQFIWLWSGCLALLFVREVRVPVPLNKLIYHIGGASMFIYMLHFTGRSLLHRFGFSGYPALDVAAGITTGVVGWWAWEFGSRWILLGFARLRLLLRGRQGGSNPHRA